jgi:hypothetical protein
VPFSHDHVRLLLDEDLPGGLERQLRSRGYRSESMHEPDVRRRVIERRTADASPRRIADHEVALEAAQVPTVLVTMNLRDYSDPQQHAMLVEEHGISVVQVRVPKKEFGERERAMAVHDIVHRWAHRFVTLEGGDPAIGTANRGGLRVRSLAAIRAEHSAREERNRQRRIELATKRAEDKKCREEQASARPPRKRRARLGERDTDGTLF